MLLFFETFRRRAVVNDVSLGKNSTITFITLIFWLRLRCCKLRAAGFTWITISRALVELVPRFHYTTANGAREGAAALWSNDDLIIISSLWVLITSLYMGLGITLRGADNCTWLVKYWNASTTLGLRWYRSVMWELADVWSHPVQLDGKFPLRDCIMWFSQLFFTIVGLFFQIYGRNASPLPVKFLDPLRHEQPIQMHQQRSGQFPARKFFLWSSSEPNVLFVLKFGHVLRPFWSVFSCPVQNIQTTRSWSFKPLSRCSPTTIDNKRNGWYSNNNNRNRKSKSQTTFHCRRSASHMNSNHSSHSICSIFFLYEANKLPLILIWKPQQLLSTIKIAALTINVGTYAASVATIEHSTGLFGLAESLMTFLFSVNTAKFVSRSISVGLR